MDSGFGDDEAYNVYDKAWRKDKDLASNIYRPSKNLDKDIYGDDLDKLIKGASGRRVSILEQSLNNCMFMLKHVFSHHSYHSVLPISFLPINLLEICNLPL